MESILNEYNIVTPILVIFFVSPLLFGLLIEIKENTIRSSLISLLRVFEFLASLFLSFHLTKLLFFESKYPFCQNIKDFIDKSLNGSLSLQTKVYLVVVPLIVLFCMLFFKIIFYKFESNYMYTLSEKLSATIQSMWKPTNLMLRILFNLPKSFLYIIMICLLLNVINKYFPSPALSNQMKESKLYSLVSKNTVEPILDSAYVKKLPVLFNVTVSQAELSELKENASQGNLPDKTKNGVRIVWYFNGLTIDDAVKSNEQIDAFARELVKSQPNDRMKAQVIYQWIGDNIKYDYDKARNLTKADKSSSGAIYAFYNRKGICFDMSSLFVAMCKATGIKTRLIIGLGYSGSDWGEHSWNQVYLPMEDKWINVDTTFSIGGNYFDNPNFFKDHRASKIAGEW